MFVHCSALKASAVVTNSSEMIIQLNINNTHSIITYVAEYLALCSEKAIIDVRYNMCFSDVQSN